MLNLNAHVQDTEHPWFATLLGKLNITCNRVTVKQNDKTQNLSRTFCFMIQCPRKIKACIFHFAIDAQLDKTNYHHRDLTSTTTLKHSYWSIVWLKGTRLDTSSPLPGSPGTSTGELPVSSLPDISTKKSTCAATSMSTHQKKTHSREMWNVNKTIQLTLCIKICNFAP